MNRRKFVSTLSGLPFLGWLKPKPDFEDPITVTLSVRGKEFQLGVELLGVSDKDKKWAADILSDGLKETAYRELGLLRPDGRVRDVG